MSQPRKWVRPVAVIAGLFGMLTVFSGGMVLFGGSAVKAAAGDAVPMVLWFNFLAGFAYIVGAVALYSFSPLAQKIAWMIGGCTLLIFALLIALIVFGTPFEGRTIGAMVLRSGFWLAIAVALTKAPLQRPQPK